MTLLALLFPLLVPPASAVPELRLVAETSQGETHVLGFAELPLVDPREAGVQIIRPEGFPRDERPLEGPIATLTLASGDLLRGRIAGGDGDFLALEIRGGVVLTLSIEELASLSVPELFPARLDEPLTAPEEGDRLFRRTAASLDRIDGTIESFTAEGVRFDSVLGSRVFPWNEVAALFVEVLAEELDDTGGDAVPVVLDLVDGSRVRGKLAEIDVQGARLRVGSSLTPVLVAWEHVEELFVDDGTLAYLSSLEPLREEGRGTPFDDDLGMRWPHRLDRSSLGGPLRAGGRSYGRGIGMHAPSRVTWRLDGRWEELRGAVAIDDSALFNAPGARGSVVFRLRLDGELLWESPLMRGGDPPRALPRIELSATGGARELELEVDPVDDFRGDRANWLRLLLVDRP